jgi:L-lactate dehydrogenase (cytochrome)
MEWMKRRLPKPAELAPLLRFKKPVANPVRRRLANAHTIGDLRRIAKRTTPRAAFDYTDGAAEDELSFVPRPAGLPRRRAAPCDPA